MLIASAAHFKPCSCGFHGRVVCADGVHSRLFVTKQGLRQEIERLAKEGKVTAEELPELRRQVDASQLIEADDMLEAWCAARQLPPTELDSVAVLSLEIDEQLARELDSEPDPYTRH